jgi:hypothetical protein
LFPISAITAITAITAMSAMSAITCRLPSPCPSSRIPKHFHDAIPHHPTRAPSTRGFRVDGQRLAWVSGSSAPFASFAVKLLLSRSPETPTPPPCASHSIPGHPSLAWVSAFVARRLAVTFSCQRSLFRLLRQTPNFTICSLQRQEKNAAWGGFLCMSKSETRPVGAVTSMSTGMIRRGAR